MEEMNVNNVAEQVVEAVNEANNPGNGVIGFVIGGAVAIGAGVFAWIKTGPKREAKQIEKLRKKGYTVIEPDAGDVDSEDSVSEEK